MLNTEVNDVHTKTVIEWNLRLIERMLEWNEDNYNRNMDQSWTNVNTTDLNECKYYKDGYRVKLIILQ